MRLVEELQVRVVVIAGNHDSPQRLDFTSRLLAAQGLHVFGAWPQGVASVTIPDPEGEVEFYALPYADVRFIPGFGFFDAIWLGANAFLLLGAAAYFLRLGANGSSGEVRL